MRLEIFWCGNKGGSGRGSGGWFHTVWIPSIVGTKLARSGLIRVGDYHYIRYLQIFHVHQNKRPPATKFERGPTIKYNHCNLGSGQGLLPLVDAAPRAGKAKRKQ